MLDSPDAKAILTQVQAALKAGIAPGFQQAVAANAVALALREEELAEAGHQAEADRLSCLLDRKADLSALNAALASAIRSGEVQGAALEAHLICTTLEKLAVDQPGYPAYRALRGGKP